MNGPRGELEARLARRIHATLTIDLAIRLGEECGILFGPSGAGKSTVLRMIAGLERPDSGRVRLGGSVLFDSEEGVRAPLRSRRIGLIFQEDLLFPHLNVEGNVRFGLHRLPRGEADARLSEVAGLCGIDHLLGRRPETLSGGERQRVGLARAIAPRPRLLLCDEPVSALDLDARHSLIDRLKAVQRAEAIPMLYVTHAIDEAVALGDRLFLLHGGKIQAEGNPLEVLAARSPAQAGPWPSLRNVFAAIVEDHDPGGRSSTVRLIDGPSLVVPTLGRAIGAGLSVAIRSEEIVLARGPIGAISARNLIDGRVDRLIRHGGDAEVLIRTDGVVWVVGLVAAAVDSLGLTEGGDVRMIIKARSCQVAGDGPKGESSAADR
ncbi:molybdenum ABC transporter ATP-binding protein [Tundrisphaera lichenicola]|uniref:molybdenum ABC transporter ATP-binding protein n=1 Tax=Tundrisphaera lichenicola TaxID=2029860 RepID=UPI003EBB16D8